MKKCWLILVLAVFLTGCGAQETFETVSDIYDAPAMAQMRQLEIALPKEAAVPSMENEDAGKIYLCNGYTLTVQTLAGGDLDRTMRQLTGFGREQLTVMETQVEGIDRYACVWSAAGEGGDQIGRAVILDDGSYHYAVTVMADSASAGELAEIWQEILKSAKLSSTD